MATKGVHILLPLPNATASTVEMDNFFRKIQTSMCEERPLSCSKEDADEDGDEGECTE